MKKYIVLVSALILCYQAIVPAESKSLAESVSFGRKCKIVMTAALFFTTAAIAGTNEESICLDPALQVHSGLLNAGHLKTQMPIGESECFYTDGLCREDCSDQLRIIGYRELKKEIEERLSRRFNGEEVRKDKRYYNGLDIIFDKITEGVVQCHNSCETGLSNCLKKSNKEEMRLEYVRQLKLFWNGKLEDFPTLTYEEAKREHAVVFPGRCEHSDCY
jgi:hypothetical protein